MVFLAKCTNSKKSMLAYGKNIQFPVFCPVLIKNCQKKVKNIPEKNVTKFLKCLPQNKIFIVHGI